MFEQNGFNFEAIEEIQTTDPLVVAANNIDGELISINGSFITGINSRGNTIERETRVGDMVDCYRNLNKPSFFSCKQREGENKGKVSGYANIIVIENPQFIVSEVSRQRVLTSNRNVHAFCRGSFVCAFTGKLKTVLSTDVLVASYSPYIGPEFFVKATQKPLTREDYRQYAIVCGSDVFLTDLNQSL